MYIVSFIIGSPNTELVSDFIHEETLEQAQALYNELHELPNLYSASIAAVIESTDYDVADEFKGLAAQLGFARSP